MKYTDLKPEHFPTGKNFPTGAFKAYTEAAAERAKGMYTRVLPCWAGGMLLSLLFSRGVGGFTGNIASLVCIFGGIIVGGLANRSATLWAKECADRLHITPQSERYALQHLKKGTVAWKNTPNFYS